jgi:hypothetical protein
VQFGPDAMRIEFYAEDLAHGRFDRAAKGP